MKTMGAAKFKEQCLALLDNLDAGGLVITKHGRPIAKLVPFETEFEHLIGCMKGKIKAHGDIFSTERRWEAHGES